MQYQYESQKNNSDYYNKYLKKDPKYKNIADKVWNRRNNRNINFKELGDALSKYLYSKKA